MDKSELLKYIGNLSQIGGCRHYTLSEGWGRGMRAADINTGSGLQYTVLPDRGLDISLASYKGINLVYLTCNGETHPSYYEPEGIGWLRTFAGGLLTTCGHTHLGPPCIDDGEHPGINEFRKFIRPQPTYNEQVFFHTMKGNQNGETTVTLKNRKIGTAVSIKFNINQLPYITQWKMMGNGEYVLGIEPSNVLCKSRKTLREENALPILQPGESTTNILEIIVNDIPS